MAMAQVAAITSTLGYSATVERVVNGSQSNPQASSSRTSALQSQLLGDRIFFANNVTGGCRRPAPLLRLEIESKESRIGKQPITIPKGVTVTLQDQQLKVKGPLGELSRVYPSEVALVMEGNVVKVSRAVESRRAREFHGLFRTLTDNMIIGVSKGFEKKLQLVGVGYRAALEKKDLVLNLGYSHQVRVPIPEGITCKVEENTRIVVSGNDKCAVGDFSAVVRKWRPPEPYKGKGIKYQDEVIRRKEGKVGKKK